MASSREVIMTMQSENKSYGFANNLAAQVTVFVVVIAAAIVVAANYLW
jgi:hypothetical protein